MKVKSCLTNLVPFYDKLTCSVDEGKTVSFVYLDFSKNLDSVSHSILMKKVGCPKPGQVYILLDQTWYGQAQRMVAN